MISNYNMLRFICFMTFLALTAAASVGVKQDKEFVTILRQGEEKNTDGSFAYYYEAADGSKRQEIGIVKNPGTQDESLVVKGSWSYIDKNGIEVIVEYIADENGFQPQGTNIPPAISQSAHDAAVRSALENNVS